jgi:hypothetical protein
VDHTQKSRNAKLLCLKYDGGTNERIAIAGIESRRELSVIQFRSLSLTNIKFSCG